MQRRARISGFMYLTESKSPGIKGFSTTQPSTYMKAPRIRTPRIRQTMIYGVFHPWGAWALSAMEKINSTIPGTSKADPTQSILALDVACFSAQSEGIEK